MLKLENVHAAYGKVLALQGVSIEVKQGEIVALLGANGAGKSTTLRAISGLLQPTHGEIAFEGKALNKMAAEVIVRAGISHVPEGRRIFPGLTVTENMRLGASIRKDIKGIAEDMEKMFTLFPDLKRLANALGWTLSGGQLQMLAIARGLMARPKLLLMDEPSLGLAPIVVQQVFQTIQEINRTMGTTVLVVEQNASIALSVAHRGYVLETGKIVLEGTAQELLKNPEVREAYLGGKRAAG